MKTNKDIRWKQRFQNYKNALGQLEDGLKVKKPDVLQKQGIIHCFEYTFELAWKTLQDFLIQERGYLDAKGPKARVGTGISRRYNQKWHNMVRYVEKPEFNNPSL